MTASELKSLGQKRADFAYKAVLEVKDESAEVQKKYSSYVRSAPALILSNGLPAALAFYLSKMKMKSGSDYREVRKRLQEIKSESERAYAYLFTHISEWLAEKANCGEGLTRGNDPLKYLMTRATVYDVMRLSREALELLNWLKKFADSMLEKEEQ